MANVRIAFWGNIANAHYPVVKALRKHGIDAHLFVGDRDPAGWRPETDDPELADNYPDWIHNGPWLRPSHSLAPWRSPVIDELKAFDLLVVSGSAPAIAQFVGRPMAFFTTGADLTVRPFPVAFRHLRSGAGHHIAHGALGLWQRRAIGKAAQIWTQPFKPFTDALERLHIDPSLVADIYFPLVVDTELFSPKTEPSPSWVDELAPESDFVVFHPSRLVLDDSPLMLRSGQTKGSGEVLKGFAEFRKLTTAKNPVLLLPDSDASRERDEARQRIDELGIADAVVWAKPPTPPVFARTEMVHLYRRADVTVNEFGAGWFGWAALEAMSCGVPVVSRIDAVGIRRLYGAENPWIHANDAGDLAIELEKLASDRVSLARSGMQSREFVIRHHSVDNAGRRAVDSVLAALDDVDRAGLQQTTDNRAAS